MKKHLLFLCGLFAAATLCFTSCDNDDDNEQDGSSNGSEMVGKLYAEPCLDLYAGQNEIKEFMTGYDLLVEAEDKLIYGGKYKEVNTVYDFEAGILDNVSIGFDETVSVSTLHNALKKKYRYVGEETSPAGTSIKYYTCPGKEEVGIGLLINMTNSVILNVVVYINTLKNTGKPAQNDMAGSPGHDTRDRNNAGTAAKNSLIERMEAAAARMAGTVK